MQLTKLPCGERDLPEDRCQVSIWGGSQQEDLPEDRCQASVGEGQDYKLREPAVSRDQPAARRAEGERTIGDETADHVSATNETILGATSSSGEGPQRDNDGHNEDWSGRRVSQ